MKIFDRIILTIYTFCLTIVSIIVILFPLEQINFLSLDSIMSYLTKAKGNYWFSLIGLAFLLASIRFLVSGVNSSRKNYIIKYTNLGEIRISTQTIEGLVKSITDNTKEIKDITTNVSLIDEKIIIKIKGQVNPNVNIPEVITNVQSQVKNHVEKCTGIEVSEIKVEINNVSAPIKIS